MGAAPPSAASREALTTQIAAVDSAASTRQRSSRGSSAKKAAPPAIIDLDRASARELETLPRIGPALASRIVADRDSLGPFGSLDGFQRVKGVGPAMVRQLASRVTFSQSQRPTDATYGSGSKPYEWIVVTPRKR
jgi:DNA uptake protein ComE-like DNA-binding protein